MKQIFISTGEASGDMHAANLIRCVHTLNNTIKFKGMGGQRMQAAGCEIIVDTKKLAVLGFIDVATHIRHIYAAMQTIKKSLCNNKPDLLILIDYSGFNLRLGKYARKRKIKTLYFICPQIWASRRYRIKTIRENIDHAAVIFPFELDIYRKAQVPVSYVGHPLIKQVKATLSRAEAYTRFHLDPHKKIIGLAPGSRQSEVKLIFPTILAAATRLKQQFNDIQFVLPLAITISEHDLQPYLEGYDLSIRFVTEDLYNLIQLCDAVIAVSGTVTFEIALMGTPMVIIYKVSPLTYAIGKHLLNTDTIGICNLISGKHIVKELIQREATGEKISAEIHRILTDSHYNKEMRKNFSTFKGKLNLNEEKADLGALILQLMNSSAALR